MLPFIQTLVRVEKFVEVSHEKYMKMMSSALWKLGVNDDGVFRMDVLIGVINGAITAKAQQNAGGGNAGLGN